MVSAFINMVVNSAINIAVDACLNAATGINGALLVVGGQGKVIFSGHYLLTPEADVSYTASRQKKSLSLSLLNRQVAN